MIVDDHLKDGNGISVVNTILRQNFIPHVFVTGDKPGPQKHRPNDIVIEKPFREGYLLEAKKRAMANAP